MSSEFIQQFDLPVGAVTITLHAEVTAENAAPLAAELAQAARVMVVVRSPVGANSPSLFATFNVQEHANWLTVEPTIPALEQQLRNDVLLPGRKVYRLRWESAVSTGNDQPLPPELSFLAASFESLAVFDSSKGVVYDSLMALPVLDLTSLRTSQLYLPFVAKQVQPTSTTDMTLLITSGTSGPLRPAYTENSTHWLMGRLAAILAGIDPPYTEIGDSVIVDQIADGDRAEDDPVRSNTQRMVLILPLARVIEIEYGDGRFFHHFYSPTSTLGLAWQDWFNGLALVNLFSGKPVRFIPRPPGDQFSSALEWGRNKHADGLDWEHAIGMYDYSASSKQLAYRWLAHVVHLLQDMAQPDHPLLQPHPGSGFHGVPVPQFFDKDLGLLVGYERLWDLLNGQWPRLGWPGCPNQGQGEKLEDFFDSMAQRSIEQANWWLTGLKVPNGSELALGLTFLGDRYKFRIPIGSGWAPEVSVNLEVRIPLMPTIPFNSPGNYRSMGETLISEAVACSAALLRFYYDIVNHPPYVVEVIVKQPGLGLPDDIAYHARWEDQWETETVNDLSSGQSVIVKRLKERQLVTLRDQALQDGRPATIEVRFGPFAQDHGGAGKEMDEDSILVRIGDILATKQAFGQQGDDGPVFWRGAFTPTISAGQVLSITINAVDRHNHFVHRTYDGSRLDSDPQTPAKASRFGPSAGSPGPAYQWQGYEPSEDRNHRLRVFADKISAGGGFSCAVENGDVFCWGVNGERQLGTTSTDECWVGHPFGIPCSTAPIRVTSGPSKFQSVSAGGGHGCAISADGDGYCWGLNDLGAGGILDGRIGTLADRIIPSPTPVFGGIKFKAISAGGGHTCGIDLNGKAYCWGNNGDGQLGTFTGFCWEKPDGSGLVEIPCSTTPITVTGNITFTSITAGLYHTCGISTSNVAYCWGWNGWGQLGVNLAPTCGDPRNPYQCSHNPVPIGVYKQISAGGLHTCAVRENNEAFCWGRNWDGELGRGTVDAGNSLQQPVVGGLLFEEIDTSYGGAYNYTFTCGLSTNGTSYCWGRAMMGRLGNGIDNIDTIFSQPSLVSTNTRYSKISAGLGHSCAAAVDGTIECWGENHLGQVGVITGETCREDGLIACSKTPVQVPFP